MVSPIRPVFCFFLSEGIFSDDGLFPINILALKRPVYIKPVVLVSTFYSSRRVVHTRLLGDSWGLWSSRVARCIICFGVLLPGLEVEERK